MLSLETSGNTAEEPRVRFWELAFCRCAKTNWFLQASARYDSRPWRASWDSVPCKGSPCSRNVLRHDFITGIVGTYLLQPIYKFLDLSHSYSESYRRICPNPIVDRRQAVNIVAMPPRPRPGRENVTLIPMISRAHPDAPMYTNIYQYRAMSCRHGKAVASRDDRIDICMFSLISLVKRVG